MTVITDNAQLRTLCQELAKSPFVTVDTEFLRDKYYYPKLCLVQIAAPDGEPYAIDPLAKEIDLSPLFDLFQNTAVVKVFHSAKQDIEIILQLSGKIPDPLFDTQVAAMVCGFGESASYATLVEKLAGGKKLDKSSRFTDWSQRPLSEKQISYALCDVTYLRDVYLKLSAMLEKHRRADWVNEEMATLLNPETYQVDADQVWQKIRTRSHSKGFLFMVKELAKWRELKARTLNVPRTHLMKDPILLQLAATAPKTYTELSKIRGIGRSAEKTIAHELLEVIDRVIETPKADIPAFPKDASGVDNSKHRATLDLLRVLLKSRASDHDVAEKLLANSDDLALLASGKKDDVACMKGWRYDVFGRDAEALLQGHLGLGVKQGKICLIEMEN